MREQVQWTSPSPLWNAAARVDDFTLRRATLQQPALLRFASDSFMDDFINMMANDPARLTEVIAWPETWRGTVAEGPVVPATSLPGLAKKLARASLNAERQKRGITRSVANELAALSTGVAPAGQTASGLITQPEADQSVFKLYQPAHQRYYLVTAHLVCGRPGLPDRRLDAARQEAVSFVLRRLFPPGIIDPNQTLPPFDPATWEEYAFVVAGKSAGWQRIPKNTPQVAELIKGEEKLPLFAISFEESDGRKRRLFAGLVPVGKRETYIAAPQRVQRGDPQPASPPKVADPRMMLVWSQVTEPWSRLLETANASRITLSSSDRNLSSGTILPEDRAQWIKGTREQIQTVSWYVLLDFAKLLKTYLPNVWASLTGQTLPDPPLSASENTLLASLGATTIPQDSTPNLFSSLQNSSYPASSVATSLRAALIAMNGVSTLDQRERTEIENGLEHAAKSYNREDPENVWPRFLFPLADPVFSDGPLPPKAPDATDDPDPLKKGLQRVNRLAELIEQALRPPRTEEMPQTGLAGQGVFDSRDGWFVIRCVFERPECGPFDPPLLSEPTRAFQLASFFDPDAPARPIRIALPLDTSPAGLRKFDKNTAFMISDVLCGQINRLKSLGLGDLIRSVLPWPLHKDLSVPDGGACKDKNDPGIQVGMICSLSIPIITICALLLLMIIVNLLDIIFRWVPYFLICFPLPGLKAKR